MIYLDNAATTVLKPITVAQAVTHVLESQSFGNPARGSHEFSVNAFKQVYECRQLIAQLFNLPSTASVAFTNNATMALNTAIKGLLKPGDHVISTVLDHNSVLRPIYQLEKMGISHDFVGLDQNGRLDYSQFEQLVRDNTKMVVCTHASNVTGELLDIDRIAHFCEQHHLLFVLDASQTAGVVPIDIEKQLIDVLCFTGHKSLFGPQGTGGICFRKPLTIEPLLTGGSGIDSFSHTQPATMPERLEAGTLNVPGIAGLAAGVQYVLDGGVVQLGKRARDLADQFMQAMTNLKVVKLYSDPYHSHVGTVALNVGGLDSAEVSDMLATDYQIATRPGAHCAPLVHESLGTKDQGIVRFSFSSFNTSDDVKLAIKAVSEIAAQLN